MYPRTAVALVATARTAFTAATASASVRDAEPTEPRVRKINVVKYILWQVDLLPGNYCVMRNSIRAVTKKRLFKMAVVRQWARKAKLNIDLQQEVEFFTRSLPGCKQDNCSFLNAVVRIGR